MNKSQPTKLTWPNLPPEVALKIRHKYYGNKKNIHTRLLQFLDFGCSQNSKKTVVNEKQNLSYDMNQFISPEAEDITQHN